jgi:hypothetical protein
MALVESLLRDVDAHWKLRRTSKLPLVASPGQPVVVVDPKGWLVDGLEKLAR